MKSDESKKKKNKKIVGAFQCFTLVLCCFQCFAVFEGPFAAWESLHWKNRAFFVPQRVKDAIIEGHATRELVSFSW